jgi:predicted nucleotidyltransferase
MVQTALAAGAPRLGDLRTHRAEILRVAAAHGASNVRVFGSVARGDAAADSDVDLLVDLEAPLHGFAYFGALDDLRHDLADLLGRAVDVVDSAGLRSLRERVLREAVPL